MHQPLEQPYKLEIAVNMMSQTSNVKIAAQFGPSLSLTHALDEEFLRLPIDHQVMNLKHGLRSKGDSGRWVYRCRPGLMMQQVSRLAGTWYTAPLPAVALAESLFQAMRSGWGFGGDCTSPRLVLLQPPRTTILCTAAHCHPLP